MILQTILITLFSAPLDKVSRTVNVLDWEVQTYDPIIQLFSDTYNNFGVKKFCHNSLLPKLRGGHPLEVSNIDQSECSIAQSLNLIGQSCNLLKGARPSVLAAVSCDNTFSQQNHSDYKKMIEYYDV